MQQLRLRAGGRAGAVNHCQSVPSADAGVAVAVAGGVREEKKEEQWQWQWQQLL